MSAKKPEIRKNNRKPAKRRPTRALGNKYLDTPIARVLVNGTSFWLLFSFEIGVSSTYCKFIAWIYYCDDFDPATTNAAFLSTNSACFSIFSMI